MTDLEKHLIPCFLCGNGIEIKYSKREKPYLVCDPCGIQVFVRGKKGIQLLSNLQNVLKNQNVAPPGHNNLEINALSNRLMELENLLEKNETKNWFNLLISSETDPVSEALKAEILRIKNRLNEFAKNTNDRWRINQSVSIFCGDKSIC